MSHKTVQGEVGILIHNPFQFFVHKNIYSALVEKGIKTRFIIDPTASFPKSPDIDVLDRTRELLLSNDVVFVEFPFDHYFSPSLVNDFLQQFSLLVSTWDRGLMKRAQTQKKVCVMYGVGKELTTFGFWKRYFDICLTYGDQHHEFLSQLTKSVVVGNPKFDDWFRGEYDKKLLQRLEGVLDKNKKTILYLPTHSDLNSIDDLATPLKEVTNEYNVIVKLHYYNATDDANSVEKLTNKKIIILDESEDLITLLHLADIVLSDNSSAIFDAMLADKPILVTDLHTEEYLDGGHRGRRSYKRGTASALTYSGSIEQRIKKDGTVMTISDPRDLRISLEQTVADPENVQKKRRALTHWLFRYQDANCGVRAADAIIELLLAESMPEKPYLAHAIDFFEQDIRRRELSKQPESTVSSLDGTEQVGAKSTCFLVVVHGATIHDIERTVLSLSLFAVKDFYIQSFSGGEKTVFREKSPPRDISISEINDRSFAQTVNELSIKYKKIIVVSAGCIFEQNTANAENYEDYLLRENTPFASGYVYKRAGEKTLWDKLAQLEQLVMVGYHYHSDRIYRGYVYEVRSKFWNSGADEPRFYLFDTSIILNDPLIVASLRDEYHLLLLIKSKIISQNIPAVFLPIGLLDTIDRPRFFKEKINTKTLFEISHGKRLKHILRPRIKLLEATVSYPYRKILLFPMALAALLRVLLLFGYSLLVRVKRDIDSSNSEN